MAKDEKPLTDNEVDDRLKAARAVLGEASGETVSGDTALKVAREALTMISCGLVAATERRQSQKP